jgi:hypothetical protein
MSNVRAEVPCPYRLSTLIWSPGTRSPELHPGGKFGNFAKVTAEAAA